MLLRAKSFFWFLPLVRLCSGSGEAEVKRFALMALVMSLAATTFVAPPAEANGALSRWAPQVRVWALTNDDGRPTQADPSDVGDISDGYDRWDLRSSDDPATPGMDSSRLGNDVARCRATRIGPQKARLRIQNVYAGYVCSFVVVTVNRGGVNLVVDDIRIDVDPALELIPLATPDIGDELKRRRRLHGTYAVRVLQDAPQGENLEFDIQVDFTHPDWRPKPPKCCRWCWR
jgi:hypothetical protein